MRRGKILALDYGTKNVGLACCDELAVTITPLPSIPNRSRKHLLSTLGTVIEEHGVEELVVGIPYNMSGTSGDAVDRVRILMDDLQTQLAIPVRGADERLTTVEAQGLWNEMTRRQKLRYRSIDSLAAVCILKRYLEES